MPKPDDWDDNRDGKWLGRKAGSYEWYEIQDNIAYWQEFEQPKIYLSGIMNQTTYAFDDDGYYVGDTLSFVAGAEEYLVAIMNSPVAWWYLINNCVDLQNGFFRVYNYNHADIPIPMTDQSEQLLLLALIHSVVATHDPRFEQLINGLVFELFFPDDLHRANIRLFDACEKAGIAKLATLSPSPSPASGRGEKSALTDAANDLATRIFANDHPIFGMLFDLQALDVVRIIEGRK